MRKVLSVLTILGFSMMIACKGKPSDAELQTKVGEMVKVPGVTAEVKEGTVTLNGTVADDAAKAAAETAARGVEGVSNVTNNITVAPPLPAAQAQPAVEVSADSELQTKVTDAIKDFPGITATVADGVIAVSGEISADKWKTLKMSLDGLNPKKVDASGLKVK